jgi:hypothetical protein
MGAVDLAVVVHGGTSMCVTSPAIINTYLDHNAVKILTGKRVTKDIYRLARKLT